MASTRSHWTHLYQPVGGDLVKPTSNDFPAILASIENAFDAAQGRFQGVYDGRYPHAETSGTGDGTVLTDANGNPSWVDFAADGSPGPRALAAFGSGSVIASTTEPTAAAGQTVLWFQLDATGQVVDILTGKG